MQKVILCVCVCQVQELTTKLTTAESAVRVAETLHTETQERLTQTIKMLEGQLEATKSELQTVHDERHKALQQVRHLIN